MYHQQSDLGVLRPAQSFRTVDAHLGWLREQYRAQTPVRTRLCRLARLVAAGHPVQFHGTPIAVAAVQRAVRGYACQRLGYQPPASECSSGAVLAALSERQHLRVTLMVGGLPARIYLLRLEGQQLSVTGSDGVARPLTPERFAALFPDALWAVEDLTARPLHAA